MTQSFLTLSHGQGHTSRSKTRRCLRSHNASCLMIICFNCRDNSEVFILYMKMMKIHKELINHQNDNAWFSFRTSYGICMI